MVKLKNKINKNIRKIKRKIIWFKDSKVSIAHVTSISACTKNKELDYFNYEELKLIDTNDTILRTNILKFSMM